MRRRKIADEKGEAKEQQRRRLRAAARALASRLRPRKPKPLYVLIGVLLKRQQQHLYLLNKYPHIDHEVSITYKNLKSKHGLTERQIKDGLKTLADEKLIRFLGQKNSKTKGFGRSDYDCEALFDEVSNPGSVLDRRDDDEFFGQVIDDSAPASGEEFPEELNEQSLAPDDDEGFEDDLRPITPEQEAEFEAQEAAEYAEIAQGAARARALAAWRPTLEFDAEDIALGIMEEEVYEEMEATEAYFLGIPGFGQTATAAAIKARVKEEVAYRLNNPGTSETDRVEPGSSDASGSSSPALILDVCPSPYWATHRPQVPECRSTATLAPPRESMSTTTTARMFKERLETKQQEWKAQANAERLRVQNDLLTKGGQAQVKLVPWSYGTQIYLVSSRGDHVLAGIALVAAKGLHARLDDLVVFCHFRGLGIGRAALSAIVDSARAAGMHSLAWSFGIDDHAAHDAQAGFLAGAGFVVDGEGAVLAL